MPLVCALCLAALPAFDRYDWRPMLAEVPASITNEEIADYLYFASAFIHGPIPTDGRPMMWYTKWDTPIRLKIVDADDRDLPVDTGPGLEVWNWVGVIRASVGIDIRVVPSADGDANAAVLFRSIVKRPGERSGQTAGGGHLQVQHDAQEIVLTPADALSSVPIFRENLGPPTLHCGARIFGESLKAFAIILAYRDLEHGETMLSQYLSECFAVGLGVRTNARFHWAIEKAVWENPLPFLGLLYSLNIDSGTPSEIVRAKLVEALAVLRPN